MSCCGERSGLEDISNTKMSERDPHKQSKNKSNTLTFSDNDLKPQSGQPVTKRFSQDKQADQENVIHKKSLGR